MRIVGSILPLVVVAACGGVSEPQPPPATATTPAEPAPDVPEPAVQEPVPEPAAPTFAVGDHVVVPNQGMGVLEAIRQRDLGFGGPPIETYAIRLLGTGGTYFVPVAEVASQRIRAPMATADLPAVLAALHAEAPSGASHSPGARDAEHTAAISTNDPVQLATVARELAALARDRELTLAEKLMHARAVGLLIDELAHVRGDEGDALAEQIKAALVAPPCPSPAWPAEVRVRRDALPQGEDMAETWEVWWRSARVLLHRAPDGAWDGFRLSALAEDGPWSALGLRNGDIVTAMGGTSLDSRGDVKPTDALVSVLGDLRRREQIEVEVVRGTCPWRWTVVFEP